MELAKVSAIVGILVGITILTGFVMKGDPLIVTEAEAANLHRPEVERLLRETRKEIVETKYRQDLPEQAKEEIIVELRALEKAYEELLKCLKEGRVSCK